jgi:hypothetical protein
MGNLDPLLNSEDEVRQGWPALGLRSSFAPWLPATLSSPICNAHRAHVLQEAGAEALLFLRASPPPPTSHVSESTAEAAAPLHQRRGRGANPRFADYVVLTDAAAAAGGAKEQQAAAAAAIAMAARSRKVRGRPPLQPSCTCYCQRWRARAAGFRQPAPCGARARSPLRARPLSDLKPSPTRAPHPDQAPRPRPRPAARQQRRRGRQQRRGAVALRRGAATGGGQGVGRADHLDTHEPAQGGAAPPHQGL